MNQIFELRGEWCLVANIKAKQPFGENGEIRLGTKHFSPNTKVYCSAPIWGDGYEQIVVAGRHRGSKKLVTMVINEKKLTNWRTQFVYLPQRLDGSFYMHPWQSKEHVEGYARSLRLQEAARNARKQGFENLNPSEVLIHALILRKEKEVKRAIERGANVNYYRSDGWTPLSAAIYRKYINLIDILLENGADLKTINYELIEDVTMYPSFYGPRICSLVEQAINELFPDSQIA